jgi:hypothetical protein
MLLAFDAKVLGFGQTPLGMTEPLLETVFYTAHL